MLLLPDVYDITPTPTIETQSYHYTTPLRPNIAGKPLEKIRKTAITDGPNLYSEKN